MYLSRFGVNNYKCLGRIDIRLTPIHVLIGENDAGKTSLVEAMAALHKSSREKIQRIFPGPWAGPELVLHGCSPPRVELWGEWSEVSADEADPSASTLRYGLRIGFPHAGSGCTLENEWIETAHEKLHLSRGGPCTHLAALKGGATSVGPEGPADLKRMEVLAETLEPAHKYTLDAKAMAVPAAIDPRRKFRLDPDGFGLPTMLLDILGNAPDVFLQLREEFCHFFPQFQKVRVESENAIQRNYDATGWVASSGSGFGSAIYFDSRTGQSIRGEQASDGAILFLGFLALAHLPEPPSLLLIEEPENGVYPKRLGEVIKILKQMVHRTEGLRFPQIVLTTHSPYVLSFFEPEEVTFLSRPKGRPDGPVRARPLRDAPNIKERMGKEFYLGELWYNLTEEDLFGEP